MERGRRRGAIGAVLLFMALVLVFMAMARVAAVEGSDADADGVDAGEDEAFEKRLLKLWTDGGGGDEEDHLRWYGDDDDDDDYGDTYDDQEVEEAAEEEEDGDDIMLGATRCPRPNPSKKKKKKRNVVKVDSFGAAGDGCADDTESDGAPVIPEAEFSPTHRRSDVGSSPHPRALFPSGAPNPGPYGPYPPPPATYAPYPPPPYPYPPPQYAPAGGTGSGTQPPYPPPQYAPYPPPQYAPYPPPQYAPYAPPPAPTAVSSGSESQNEAVGTIQPNRPKRLDWSTNDEEKLVHAWLFHSKDSISGKSKTGGSFWGQIAETFNSTSAPSRHRTAKQLKDHWNVYNREVTLFNGYYTQEEGLRQSGADDEMVMKAAMARYDNDTRVTQPFRRLTWWQAVRNEPKWKRQHGPGSGSDSTAKRSRLGVSGEYSSGGGSEDTAEEEERPLGRDRGRVAARKEKGKRKGKESSSSSEVGSKTFAMKNMWSGLVKAKLLKQWNKMKDRSTTDMNEEEKRKHAKAMKMVETELGLDDDED